MSLPSQWIERIFARLQGIYGQQFTAKFSRMDSGKDVGMLNAKEVWSDELGGFADNGEAIAYALKNLPSDFCPNAIEFRDICRRAPRKEAPALEHKLTEEDHQRAKAAAASAAAALKPKFSDGIDQHWATHPRSAMHLRFIFDAAGRDARFQPCIAQMVEKGICTAEGQMLKRYAGTNQWTRV